MKLLAELRSHKCLASVATADIAQQLATNGWTAGKSVPVMVQAIRELAGKAGIDAAAGHPWEVGYLRSKLVSFVMRARPAPVDAPRGGAAAPAAARPESERIDVEGRQRAKQEGRARLRSTGTEGGGGE